MISISSIRKSGLRGRKSRLPNAWCRKSGLRGRKCGGRAFFIFYLFNVINYIYIYIYIYKRKCGGKAFSKEPELYVIL